MAYPRMLALALIGLLVLFSTVVVAQEESPEETTIPYYQSPDFNVPVVAGWENRSKGNAASFTNEDRSAWIEATFIESESAEEGIAQVIAERLGTNFTDPPRYTNKVNLADGTWTQEIYQLEDITVSAFGQVRGNRTYVITFTENMPIQNTYMLITQNQRSEDVTDNKLANIASSIQEIFGEATTFDIEGTREVQLPTGTWTRREFIHNNDETLSTLALLFGNATYITIVEGDSNQIEEISNAFNTVFLGFFVTPNNDPFLYLGLAATAIILIVVIVSIWWRYRNANKDLRLIEELAES